MFRKLHEPPGRPVAFYFEDALIEAPRGVSVAAALLAADAGAVRSAPVSGEGRAPYCLMGVCFDCLVEIDGVANRQACLVEVREGMRVKRQAGAREAAP